MTELKREQIFAEREAEKDEVLKMRRLSTMVRAHQGGDDTVARAAKRTLVFSTISATLTCCLLAHRSAHNAGRDKRKGEDIGRTKSETEGEG